MKFAFPLNAKVRFTQERLSILTPRDRQGLAGRIGVIQTDGNFVRQPTVYFPADDVNQELRLFRVEPRHIELVESPPSPQAAPQDAGETATDLSHDTTEVKASTPDEGDDKLSQSDMDKLFD
jgi:hypothetical protein